MDKRSKLRGTARVASNAYTIISALVARRKNDDPAANYVISVGVTLAWSDEAVTCFRLEKATGAVVVWRLSSNAFGPKCRSQDTQDILYLTQGQERHRTVKLLVNCPPRTKHDCDRFHKSAVISDFRKILVGVVIQVLSHPRDRQRIHSSTESSPNRHVSGSKVNAILFMRRERLPRHLSHICDWRISHIHIQECACVC